MLRVHTFGRLHVRGSAGVVSGSAAQPRRLAILALLASAGDQGVTRDKVLAYLWPDTEEERARPVLNQAIYALRQDLGSDDVIQGTRALRLNPELISSDIAEFEEALTRGRLEDAVGRYVGPFLDGFRLPGAPEFDRWVEEERAGLAGSYAESLGKLARQAEDHGDWAGAVDWWRKAAAQDPLNGRTALRLMKAMVAAGDRTGALRHARVYEALIHEELDLPPDREVVAYAEQLRLEPPAEAAPAVAAPAASVPAAPTPVTDAAPVSPAPPVGQPASPHQLPGSLIKASRLLARTDIGEAESTQDWVAVLKGPLPKADAPKWTSLLRWLVAAAAIALLLGGLALLRLRVRPRDVAFGATHPLALEGALEMDPAISPDGKVVAYAADPGGRMRIYLRQVAGGPAVSRSDSLPGYHRAPRWSPDGSQIAFQAGGAIYVIPALGGNPRPLVRPSTPSGWVAYPAWSPDGKQIGYVENSVIVVRPVEGGSPTRLAAIDAPHELAWSPDGKWIACVSGNAAFTYGAEPWGSPTNLGNVAPSSIWLAPSSGGPPVPVTDDASLNTSPAWLPGSRTLLFVSSRLGSRDVFRVTLDPSGKPIEEPVRLTTGLNAQGITLSADGRHGAYSVFIYSANIWSLDFPTGAAIGPEAAQPVTSGSQAIEGIALSPDGKWLAFDSNRNGSQEIYRLSLAGGEPEPLTQSAEPDFVSGWSPDGREIAFYSYRRGTRRVYVMPAEGGLAREIAPKLANQRNPAWSPDGAGLVFSAAEGEHPNQIYVTHRGADSAWGTPRRLTTDGGASPRWSPDGRTIAFINRRSIWLMTADGTNPQVLVPASDSAQYPVPELLQWPGGRTVLYKAFDAEGRSSIWSISAKGGVPRLLVHFDDPARPSSRPEFATDGKRFFFTLGQRQSDVWTVDLIPAR